jgi:hypothetical protein
LGLNNIDFLYKATPDEVVWREWDGLYAVFCRKNEATHFIDPIGSAVFEQLIRAERPLPLESLVSCIVCECGDDIAPEQISRLVDERLPQLQSIGLVEAIPMS